MGADSFVLGRVLAQSGMLVGDHGPDWVRREQAASVEKGELDQHGDADEVGSELVDELHGGGGSATGGKEIVHDQDIFAGKHCILVEFDVCLSIFERVGGFAGEPGQFAFFPHGNESGAQAVGHGRGKDEATGIDSHHLVHRMSTMGGAQQGDGFVEKIAIGEDGRDVFENDAGFGEIDNITNGGADQGGGVHSRRGF